MPDTRLLPLYCENVYFDIYLYSVGPICPTRAATAFSGHFKLEICPPSPGISKNETYSPSIGRGSVKHFNYRYALIRYRNDFHMGKYTLPSPDID